MFWPRPAFSRRSGLTVYQDQKQKLVTLSDELPTLKSKLRDKISAVDRSCLEAKVEENDYTVLTFDDLEYELELAEANIRKKIAFVENQVGGPTHTWQ